MARAGTWKLNHYHGHRPERHDLALDPAHAEDVARLQAMVLVEWNPETVLARLRLQQIRGSVLRGWATLTHPPEQIRWSMHEG